jgi:hypothetical protein
MDQDHSVTWNSQIEQILSEEGERSLCYSWLHSKSENFYSKLNTYLSLPVIMLSTIAGAGSIGTESLFKGSPTANIVIGCISLSVATLNTIGSYFSWAKRSESHRIAATTYKKVYRFILIELALPRHERIVAKDMLKIVREQCDRLQETSPQIPEGVILEFKLKFGTTTPDVAKPEITNGLHAIIVHSPDHVSPKISTSDHTQDMLQKLSLAHPLNESASGSNHTLSSSYKQNTT